MSEMPATAKPETGGPAYPCGNKDGAVSLRDWFACSTDLSGVEFPDAKIAAKALGIDLPYDNSVEEQLRFGARLAAALRFMFADAMLKERAK